MSIIRIARRLPRRVSLVGILLVGAAGCAEQRSQSSQDSSAALRPADTPEGAFRAQIGQTWELARLENQDIPLPHDSIRRSPGRYPGGGSRPTIRFTNEPAGALAGDTGRPGAGGRSFCNGWGTAYELGPGDQLRFHGFQSTLVGCDGPDSLETRYFRGLHSTRRFELDSSSLSLVAEDGSRLTFIPAPDSIREPPT